LNPSTGASGLASGYQHDQHRSRDILVSDPGLARVAVEPRRRRTRDRRFPEQGAQVRKDGVEPRRVDGIWKQDHDVIGRERRAPGRSQHLIRELMDIQLTRSGTECEGFFGTRSPGDEGEGWPVPPDSPGLHDALEARSHQVCFRPAKAEQPAHLRGLFPRSRRRQHDPTRDALGAAKCAFELASQLRRRRGRCQSRRHGGRESGHRPSRYLVLRRGRHRPSVPIPADRARNPAPSGKNRVSAWRRVG
jgi:hypothetical protein